MSIGIVRKVKFVNSSPGYHLFKGMVERIDRPQYFKIWDFLDATCYLYVDYLNETGKLKTFVFKNQYYYDDMSIVMLDINGEQIKIDRQISGTEINDYIDDLKEILTKEKEQLARERDIIKTRFGETKAQTYDLDREELIDFLDNIISGSIRELNGKLINLAKHLINSGKQISEEQFRSYSLLITYLSDNFDKINNLLRVIGEPEIDPQIIYDIYNILYMLIGSKLPVWETCSVNTEFDNLGTKQLIKLKYSPSELRSKY